MKFKFNRIVIKTSFLIMITNIILFSILMFFLSNTLFNNYESEVNNRIENELKLKRTAFETSLVKIESAVDALRLSISELYAINDNKSSLDSFENQILMLLTHYLQDVSPASYSVYVYFDPFIDNDSHDVWLTNESNAINRHDEIPMERYNNKANMPLFYNVKESLENRWIPPYQNQYDQYITSYVMPILSDNTFIGIIGMYLDLDMIHTNFQDVEFSKDDFFWVVNEEGTIIYHPFHQEGLSMATVSDNIDLDNNAIYQTTRRKGNTIRHYTSVSSNDWTFIHSINENEFNTFQTSLIWRYGFGVLIILILSQLLIYLIYNYYQKQFNQILNILDQGRLGNYKEKLIINTHDELGMISYAINNSHDQVNQVKSRLEKIAYHNQLTQLGNWEKLVNDFKYQTHNNDIIMYLVDIDDFKKINQLVGIKNSDSIIQTLSQKLLSISNENFKLYHLSYDEFVFIEISSDYESIERHANMILEVFNQYTYSVKNNFNISCSIGVSKYPDDAFQPEELLKCAEIALVQAKADGKKTYKIYSRFMSFQDYDVDAMAEELNTAIKNKQFIIYYQPVFDRELVLFGLEALIRWQHPSKGLLLPHQFLDIANHTGLINTLGEYTLAQICDDVNVLKDASIFPNFISMNLSQRQILNPVLISMFLGIIRDHKTNMNMIELEITESVTDYDHDNSIKKLKALEIAGVSVCLDDWGTGDISIKTVQELPLHRVKLDPALLKLIETDKNSINTIQSLIDLAHSLNLKVCAKGIEKPSDLNILMKLNCDEFQGYHFCDPQSKEDLIQYFNKKNH